MSTEARAARRALLSVWIAVSVVSAGIGLILAGGAGATAAGRLYIVALNITYWNVWGVLGVGIFWLARHVTFGNAPFIVALPVHLGAAAAAAVLHIVLLAACQYALQDLLELQATWDSLLRSGLTNRARVEWALTTYFVIVGAAHAIRYYTEAQQRALAELQLRAQLREAQLQALRRQLDPHFVGNALNAISGLIRTNPDAADEMIERLGGLLRATLRSRSAPEVPLRDELAMLALYIDVEKVRFADRLRYHQIVDPNVADALIPPLLLQPLVENAVRHGVRCCEGGGDVTLEIRITPAQMLQIEIVNDDPRGPGSTEPSHGVGLANTRERLLTLYGAQHRFEWRRERGTFRVLLEFPCRSTPRGLPVGALLFFNDLDSPMRPVTNP